jgi:hypothetical protein
MNITIIDKLYSDYLSLSNYLEANREISLMNDADNNFKKVLLLSIASFFEYESTQILLDFISKSSNCDARIYSFTKRKAVDRQYHTYFNWDIKKGANQFFSLFGDEFKKDIEKDLRSNDALEKAIRDFLEIGSTRNELVHENFANFTLDKTAKEIFELYRSASVFVDYLAEKFS